MSREINRYTRWRPADNDDEEEVDDDSYMPSLEHPLEILSDDDDQMQEGRRVLAMTAASTKKPEPLLSSAAMSRVVFIAILVCSAFFLLGAFIVYLTMTESHNTLQACPMVKTTPSPSDKGIDDGLTAAPSISSWKDNVSLITKPSTATTATTTTTTTIKPETADSPPAVDTEDVRSLQSHLLSNLTPDLIRKYIENITNIPADKEVQNFVMSTFKSLGYQIKPKVFPVMMSLPDVSDPTTVEIVLSNNNTKIINNATSSMKSFTPYSGFSPNGTVSGLLVYAHFARLEDFDLLKKKGVPVNGSIILVRSCKIHPGIQVRNAEKAGAKGVIIYPDPVDFIGDSPEGKVYPDSMALPLDGIIWQNLRFIPGDPSTPWFASQKEAYRISTENYTGIPSVIVHPVSSESGKTLLALLGGLEAPNDWQGSLTSKYYLGGTFKVGENVREIRIKCTNYIAEEHITNVHALLPAEDSSKVIHVGSRFDSKGATPTSSALGLASLLALADALKHTFPNGTKRQIVFSVFVAMDDDLAGGNEYSQLYSSWLETSGVAYIDMDTILEGSGYIEANVSPLLRETVREVLNLMAWPEGEGLNVMQGLLRNIPADKMLINSSNMQEAFNFHNPFECDEAMNYHSVHGIPTVQLKAISVNQSASYTLKNSQYDTMEALINLEDKHLSWTHLIASLLGMTTLMLSSMSLPPAGFQEVAYDLKKGWRSFLLEQRSNLNRSDIPLHDILGEISGEFSMFILTLESYDTWYKKEKNENEHEHETPAQHFRALEDRLSKVIHFSRRFLRPRGAPQHAEFGLLLTYGPDPTNPCEGTYFPTLRKVLLDAVAGTTPWFIVKEELSYLYGMLTSINTDIIRYDEFSLSL